MIEQKFIFVTFQKEGIHRYPGAPTGVEFLRNPHRHMFHFRVEIEVFNDDRDIEFILFKRELEALYDNGDLNRDYMSCEMMADELAKYLRENYLGRDIKIEISEDGENGTICYYPKITQELSPDIVKPYGKYKVYGDKCNG